MRIADLIDTLNLYNSLVSEIRQVEFNACADNVMVSFSKREIRDPISNTGRVLYTHFHTNILGNRMNLFFSSYSGLNSRAKKSSLVAVGK